MLDHIKCMGKLSSNKLSQMQSNKSISDLLLLELVFREIVIHMTALVLKQRDISLNVAEVGPTVNLTVLLTGRRGPLPSDC